MSARRKHQPYAGKVVLVFLALLLLYIIYGAFFHNFYYTRRDARAKRASLNQLQGAPLEIGVLWGMAGDDSFLTAAELAVDEINSAGLVSDGGPVRQLRLHPRQLSPDLRVGSRRQVGGLAMNRDLVAIIGSGSEKEISEAMVICEVQGVAFMASVHTPLEKSFRSQYILQLKPSLIHYARKTARDLHKLKADLPDKLKVGIFFEGTSPDGQRQASVLFEEMERQNELIQAAGQLQSAINQGNLNPNLKLQQLQRNPYLQAGVTRDPAAIADFIQDCFLQGRVADDLTISQALEGAELPPLEIETMFIEAFLPSVESSTDYRPMISNSGAMDVDVIILMSELPGTVPLIQNLRQMRVSAELLSVDVADSTWLRQNLGDEAEELVMLSVQDLRSTDPDYRQFLERFRESAIRKNRIVQEAGEMALLGYRSIELLAAAYRRENSSNALDLVNILKHSLEPFEVTGSQIQFRSDGTPVDQELHFVRYRQGRLEPVGEEAENDNSRAESGP